MCSGQPGVCMETGEQLDCVPVERHCVFNEVDTQPVGTPEAALWHRLCGSCVFNSSNRRRW